MIDQRWLSRVSSRWVTINGSAVHYLEIGSGPPAIMIHGMGGSANDWSENVGALGETAHLHILDLPGFGLSPPPEFAIDYTYEYVASFVAAFADHLGLDRLFLIGNSLGGAVSLRFAIDFPERTIGVIIANASGLGVEIERTIRLLSIPGVARLVLPRVTRRQVQQTWENMFVDPAKITPESVDRTYRWIQKPEVQRFLETIYRNGATFLGQKMLLLEDLPRVQCPTMIVWGADDAVVPVVHGIGAFRLIESSILHILRHCGHVPQMEQADTFNSLTLEFLRRSSL